MKEKLIYEKEYPRSERRNQHDYNNTEASEIPSNNSYFGIQVNEQYTIIPERDLAARLDFYTHVVVRNGISVAP